MHIVQRIRSSVASTKIEHTCGQLSPTNDATDLTDAQWAAIAPLVTAPHRRTGARPTSISVRIVNAYSPNIAPHQWRLLPANFLPMSSVRSYFDTWNRNGIFIKINNTLRQLVQKALDRDLAALAVMAPHVRRSCSPVSSAMRLSRPGSLTCLYCASQRRWRVESRHRRDAVRPVSRLRSWRPAPLQVSRQLALALGQRFRQSVPGLLHFWRRTGAETAMRGSYAGLLAMIRMAWRNVNSGRGR
jgi:transposase